MSEKAIQCLISVLLASNVAKNPDHSKASKPAATATTAGIPVAAALLPLALECALDDAADAAELAELAMAEVTELAEAEAELADLEVEAEADDALDDASDTAPKTPP